MGPLQNLALGPNNLIGTIYSHAVHAYYMHSVSIKMAPSRQRQQPENGRNVKAKCMCTFRELTGAGGGARL